MNVTAAEREVTLCDPIWHMSSCSCEACYILCLLYFTLLFGPRYCTYHHYSRSKSM